MTEQEVQAFCANNGISVSAPGQPLHVVDPQSLPPSVRTFVNDDGTYKGDSTPEAEDPRHEQSKGEEDSDPSAVAKQPTDEERGSEVKKGKLPDEFPHRSVLEAAGITTYAKVRALGGDYGSVSGIGEAKGAEIDAALGETE